MVICSYIALLLELILEFLRRQGHIVKEQDLRSELTLVSRSRVF